jgi:hypothetical protein
LEGNEAWINYKRKEIGTAITRQTRQISGIIIAYGDLDVSRLFAAR